MTLDIGIGGIIICFIMDALSKRLTSLVVTACAFLTICKCAYVVAFSINPNNVLLTNLSMLVCRDAECAPGVCTASYHFTTTGGYAGGLDSLHV